MVSESTGKRATESLLGYKKRRISSVRGAAEIQGNKDTVNANAGSHLERGGLTNVLQMDGKFIYHQLFFLSLFFVQILDVLLTVSTCITNSFFFYFSLRFKMCY